MKITVIWKPRCLAASAQGSNFSAAAWSCWTQTTVSQEISASPFFLPSPLIYPFFNCMSHRQGNAVLLLAHHTMLVYVVSSGERWPTGLVGQTLEQRGECEAITIPLLQRDIRREFGLLPCSKGPTCSDPKQDMRKQRRHFP